MAVRSGVPPRLISIVLASRSKGLFQNALDKGARTLYKADDDENSKSRMGPVILENVTREMSLFADESFGPSCSLYIVENDGEAIDMANDTPYGLTSAVFTKNLMRGFKFARAIVSGAIHVNGPTIHLLAHFRQRLSGIYLNSRRQAYAEIKATTLTEDKWAAVAARSAK